MNNGQLPVGGVVEVNFDLVTLVEQARIGVRRAAAFLGWGFHTTQGEPLVSVTLPGEFQIQILPDPLSPEQAREIQSEYRSWLVGACLAELDQAFQRFQDGVWRACEYADRVGTVVPPGWVPSPLRGTNSGTRHATILSRLAPADADLALFRQQLSTLTFVRNCLMHDGGLLTADRAGGGDHLTARWAYLGTFIEGPDGEQEVGRGLPQVGPFDGEVPVFVRIGERLRHFPIGQVIRLDPHDQIEICLFYQLLADRTMRPLVPLLEAKGLVPVSPAE